MKFKLKHTKLQILLECIAALVIIGMYAYLILRWNYLPDKIPGHYNFAGEVDRWGNKSELAALPVIATVLYLLLTVVTFFPSIWNMPVQVTDENRDKVYGNMKYLLLVLKLEVELIFFYIMLNDVKAKPMSPFFLPVFFAVLFGTLAFFIVKAVKAGKK